MLLMVETRTRGEYVIQHIEMQKQIINIWKIMVKMKNHHKFSIGIKIIYMTGQCLKNIL